MCGVTLGINPSLLVLLRVLLFVYFCLLRHRAITPIDLLLQDYAVNTGFEKRKGQACFALELAKAVEDF